MLYLFLINLAIGILLVIDRLRISPVSFSWAKLSYLFLPIGLLVLLQALIIHQAFESAIVLVAIGTIYCAVGLVFLIFSIVTKDFHQLQVSDCWDLGIFFSMTSLLMFYLLRDLKFSLAATALPELIFLAGLLLTGYSLYLKK